ncbi:hypothetical protein FPSM_02279 [Flavobacterium psychrophilum]|nr:hypothetical protein FPSM_02279 [Flavobacterium psychrophilum]
MFFYKNSKKRITEMISIILLQYFIKIVFTPIS